MSARSPLPLLTARLRLRALAADDLEDLCRVWMDPLVMEWIGAHTRADVAHELSEQIESEVVNGFSLWAVEERSSGRFLGDCGLQLLEMRGPEVEVGYELLPEAWVAGSPRRRSRRRSQPPSARSRSSA